MLKDPHYRLPVPSFNYADKLYPKELIKMMEAVAQGRWLSAQSPEKAMDDVLVDWVAKNVTDPARYADDIITAVLDTKCLEMTLIRLNVEAVLEPDKGDTITINTNRRFRLKGEASSHLEVDEEGNIVDLDAAKAAPDNINDLQNGQIYAGGHTIVKRQPNPSLSENAKQFVKDSLRRYGYQIITKPSIVLQKLESTFRFCDAEQNILARIAYLIAFHRLRRFDSNSFVTALLPYTK